MEILKSLMKLTPEERQKEVRRGKYIELRAVEIGCRERVALEIAERCKSEKEDRKEATENQRRQREKHEVKRMRRKAKQRKEERRANEQKALEGVKEHQLRKERLY
eukprot:superscaffoldBa00001397_g10369